MVHPVSKVNVPSNYVGKLTISMATKNVGTYVTGDLMTVSGFPTFKKARVLSSTVKGPITDLTVKPIYEVPIYAETDKQDFQNQQ